MELTEFLERYMSHKEFIKFLATQGNGIKSTGEKAIKLYCLCVANFPEMIKKYTEEIKNEPSH
jgi:hypothetical protein